MIGPLCQPSEVFTERLPGSSVSAWQVGAARTRPPAKQGGKTLGIRRFFKSLASGHDDQALDVPSLRPVIWPDPGSVDVEVSGESYHRNAFAQIFTAAGRPLGGVLMRNAVLVPDPANPYDPNAVAVYVDGLHVGYVPAEAAPRLQPVAIAYARQHRQLTVLARLWACCESGYWSARVTLSFSGAAEDEWSYVDHASWPGDRSPDGTQRLTDTARVTRVRDAEAAGLIRGRDYEALRPEIAQAKSDGDLDTALALLRECIDAAERRAGVYGVRPPPWPTEQAAIILRSLKDYLGEVAVLERFLNADPRGQGTKAIRERLVRARSLAGDPLAVRTSGIADKSTQLAAVELNHTEPVVAVALDCPAELVREAQCESNIRAVMAEEGVALGAAFETQAVLRETPSDEGEFTTITAYVNGRLVGQVGALYAEGVRAVLHDHRHQGRPVALRCRIYATDKPKWTARITLGPYENVVAAVDDSQAAAEGRSVTDAMARLRQERLNVGGDVAEEQRARLVRDRDFVEWVEPIKELRRAGRDPEAFKLLMECIDVAERDARAHRWPPPTWYTEQAAIILRKQDNLAGESPSSSAMSRRVLPIALRRTSPRGWLKCGRDWPEGLRRHGTQLQSHFAGSPGQTLHDDVNAMAASSRCGKPRSDYPVVGCTLVRHIRAATNRRRDRHYPRRIPTDQPLSASYNDDLAASSADFISAAVWKRFCRSDPHAFSRKSAMEAGRSLRNCLGSIGSTPPIGLAPG